MTRHTDRDRHSDEGDERHLSPLVRIGDPGEANVIAAMLRSAGIDVRMHGASFGPYPVGIGELAEVEIWVDIDDLDDARDVLAAYRE